jgi:hypothetical protein
VPIRAANPGLAAYKPPPAAVVNYGPAKLPAPPAHDAVTSLSPGPPTPAKETIGQGITSPVLQPNSVNTAPASMARTKTAAPKRQRTVRRPDPRQKTNEFAYQPFFGGFRPWN